MAEHEVRMTSQQFNEMQAELAFKREMQEETLKEHNWINIKRGLYIACGIPTLFMVIGWLFGAKDLPPVPVNDTTPYEYEIEVQEYCKIWSQGFEQGLKVCLLSFQK